MSIGDAMDEAAMCYIRQVEAYRLRLVEGWIESGKAGVSRVHADVPGWVRSNRAYESTREALLLRVAPDWMAEARYGWKVDAYRFQLVNAWIEYGKAGVRRFYAEAPGWVQRSRAYESARDALLLPVSPDWGV